MLNSGQIEQILLKKGFLFWSSAGHTFVYNKPQVGAS